MAYFNPQEQEQIDKIKYFFGDWGKYLIAVAGLIIISGVLYLGWNWYHKKQALNAFTIYNQIAVAAKAKNNAKIYQTVNSLENNYGSTEYASMGSILGAKAAFTNQDYPQTEKFLIWVQKNSSDQGLIAVAIIRLATLYIQQKKFSLALETLTITHPKAFDALFNLSKGDAYLSQNDKIKAQNAYNQALLNATSGDSQLQQMIQFKLNALGV